MAGQTASGSSEPRPRTTSKPDARAAAKTAAQTAKQEAASFADQAKDKASEKLEDKTGVAADALSDFADAVRRAADELSDKDRSTASRMVNQAADGLQDLSRTISQKTPEALLRSLRDFGRENPAAFAAGSVLAGLALGRFLRASDRPREDEAQDPRDAGSGPVDGQAGASQALADDADEAAAALGRGPRSGDAGALPGGEV